MMLKAFIGMTMLLVLGVAALLLIPGGSNRVLDLLAGIRPAPEVIVVRAVSQLAPSAVSLAQQPASTSAIGSVPELSPTSEPVPAQPSMPEQPRIDQRFAAQPQGWPIQPPFAIWSDGAYRLSAQTSAHFVAVEAPLQPASGNVFVNASFRKTGGPPGGGFGIVVRHQTGRLLDGSFQGGQYYVLEATDRGEVGVWRRDEDVWADLLSWTHADAVQTGSAANQLSVQTIGDTMVFLVNGIEVTRRTDAALPSGGGVGIFVGGDGNEVAVDHFSLGLDH